MPPKRAEKRQKSPGREGRILLAIKAIKNHEIPSQRQAAAIFKIPLTTLQDRLNGVAYKGDTRNGRHKLTQEEEDSLT
jgi:hypothetical protein